MQSDVRRRAETSDAASGVPAVELKTRAKSCGEYDSRTGMMARSNRYKTELCRSFKETGECRYGRKCQFAHGAVELRAVDRHPRYKTELCKAYHFQGYCSYGTRCHFIHDEHEAATAAAAAAASVSVPVPLLPPPQTASGAPVLCRLQPVIRHASQAAHCLPVHSMLSSARLPSELLVEQADSAYSSSSALF